MYCYLSVWTLLNWNEIEKKADGAGSGQLFCSRSNLHAARMWKSSLDGNAFYAGYLRFCSNHFKTAQKGPGIQVNNSTFILYERKRLRNF